MENVIKIPVQTVINTILENLVDGLVITKDEKEEFRPVVEAMEGHELITMLLESHILRENVKKFYDSQFHLSERMN